MASRGGAHVSGTDGTDYLHREQVAGQYAVSATNKSRLKGLVFVHYLLGAAHLVRLLPSLMTLLGVSVILPLPPTPLPSLVEYAWLLSLPFTLLAMSACRRSKSGPLQVFQLVLLLSCVIPALITIYNHSSDTISILTTGSTKDVDLVLGYPFPLLWSVLLLACLLVHGAEIVVTRTLVQAWAPRHGKRQ
eukprot:GFUD01042803.1.p1 GENE.GFUD01042803.1~~GFUD01042803.1.p1  ORF type:complete len:190 (+),score=55.34 GFUD01042803.1:41-610(+)